MHTGKGQVVEVFLQNGQRAARISCPAGIIPSPGQYLLSGTASDVPLPVSVLSTGSVSGGFFASSVPEIWKPGLELNLRGPLGRGFTLPATADKIGLIAFDDTPVRLIGLIDPSLRQSASVVLVSGTPSEGLADEVEVQPLSALADIVEWADYLAFDVARENLSVMREKLETLNQASALRDAQVLIHTAMPCGGVADCGVCSVVLRSGWKMACKDGPVFDWMDL